MKKSGYLALYLLFFAIPLLAQQDTAEYTAQCISRGGQMIGITFQGRITRFAKQCICPSSNEAINPYTHRCPLNEMEQAVNELNKMGSNPFCGPSSETLDIRPEIQVDRTLLCTNPAKVICDEKLNGDTTRKHLAAQLQFSALQKEYSKNPKGFHNKLFTNKRKKSAINLVKQAKQTMTQLLRKKLKDHPQRDQLIQKISNIEVHFGRDQVKQPLDYNMYATELRPLAETKTLQPTLVIQGFITMVDTEPEAFYFLLLHELSHFFDPCLFSSFYPKASFPFSNEVQCLKQDGSAGAHENDIGCFNKAAQKSNELGIPINKGIQNCFKMHKKNPQCAGKAEFESWDPRIKKCNVTQINETFADWMATEALAESFKSPNIQNEIHNRLGESADDASAEDYTQALFRTQAWNQLRSQTGSLCPSMIHSNNNEELKANRNQRYKSHLRTEDRINSVIFAHPSFKKSLGCAKNHIDSPKHHSKYCGGDSPLK
jgi:hypothetical protein